MPALLSGQSASGQQAVTDTISAQQNKFHIGLKLGAGYLDYSRGDDSTHTGVRFGLGIRVEYQPLEWLRTGIVLGGWTIEPTSSIYDDNPEKGIGVSCFYASLMAKPVAGIPFWFGLAGGWNGYRNSHPEKYSAKGSGLLAGIIFEQPIGKKRKTALTAAAEYGFGKLKEKEVPVFEIRRVHRYYVFEAMLGIRHRF